MSNQSQGQCPMESATILDFVAINSKRMNIDKNLTQEEAHSQSNIAHTLDAALEEMVVGIEGIASCQQETKISTSELPPEIGAFCVGMEHLSRSLFPHLASTFEGACKQENINPTLARPILQSRLEALASYMLQLTQVHGLVLKQTADPGPPPVASLRMTLKGLAKKTLEPFS